MSEYFSLRTERQRPNENEPTGRRYDLSQGGAVRLGESEEKWPLHDGSRAKLSAVIGTSAADGLEADMLMVFDLTDVPISDGVRNFMGQPIAPDVQSMMISEEFFQSHKRRGYKGLRAGERYAYGRATHDGRFTDQSLQTSRTHFLVSCNERNQLLVQDLNSSNGTVVMTGEAGVDFVADYLITHGDDVPAWLGVNGAEEVPPTPALISTAEVATEKHARVMSQSEIKGIRHELKTYTRQFDVSLEIAHNYPEFKPIRGLEIEGRKLAFGPLFSDKHDRLHSIAYTPDEAHPGHWFSRLYYRSNSDGGWRVTPGIYDKGVFSKGDPVQDLGGEYVWLTKPDRRIVDLLEDMEQQPDEELATTYPNSVIDSLFKLRRLNEEGSNHFDEEVTPVYIDGGRDVYGAYFPGRGYLVDPETARFKLTNMKLPAGFEPDFSRKPAEIYQTRHTIGGQMVVEVYEATYKGQPIEWHVANDARGSTWIDRIKYKSTGLTDYGTLDRVIVGGALAAKPYEYRTGMGGAVPGVDYLDNLPDGHSFYYVTTAPIIQMMPWYRHYRADHV